MRASSQRGTCVYRQKSAYVFKHRAVEHGHLVPTVRLAMAFFALILPVFAQAPADTGQISGIVKDPDQAAVSGSQVTLTNQQTKSKATAVTDGQGAYAFTSLRPGSYTVEVDAANFKA